jgi:hypothetical protein
MEEKIKVLYESLRSQMLAFEQIGKTINEIEDKNIVHVKLKESLKGYSNNILSEMLFFSDYLFRLSEVCDPDDMELILQEFMEVDDEEL